MEILVDGKAFEPTGDSPNNVGEVIDGICRNLESRRLCMVRVEVDGTEVTSEDISAYFPRSVGEFSKLEVRSASVSSLVLASLDELSDYAARLSESIIAVAAVLKTDDPGEGLEALAQMAEIWIEILQRVSSVTDALGLDLSEITIGGQSAAKHHELLSQGLNRACELAESKDYKTLSEILEYDLAPLQEAEGKLLERLRELCLESENTAG